MSYASHHGQSPGLLAHLMAPSANYSKVFTTITGIATTSPSIVTA